MLTSGLVGSISACPRGARAGLRQQQRLRCRIRVSIMHLKRAARRCQPQRASPTVTSSRACCGICGGAPAPQEETAEPEVAQKFGRAAARAGELPTARLKRESTIRAATSGVRCWMAGRAFFKDAQ